MSTATIASPAVTEFAAAVRGALLDLTADEIEDLTDGLEADLTERIADGGADDLGDPAAYAEELRAAAGLPRRAVASPGLLAGFAELLQAPRSALAAFRTSLSRHPTMTRFAEFAVTLRPAWWVFRALVAAVLFVIWSGMAPINGFSVLFAGVALVVSVQFGRGRWLPFAWMKALVLAANVLLVIATPFIVAGWATQLNNATYIETYADSFPDPSASGLTLDGAQVSNVFAYDAQGNPLTDVQLFNQDGKPLNLVGDSTAASEQGFPPGVLVPNQAVPGRLGWNVYPLAHVSLSDLNDDGSIKESARLIPAVAPFATAKPLADTVTAPTSSPPASSGATSSPSATPTPAP